MNLNYVHKVQNCMVQPNRFDSAQALLTSSSFHGFVAGYILTGNVQLNLLLTLIMMSNVTIIFLSSIKVRQKNVDEIEEMGCVKRWLPIISSA